ncbi:RNA-binding protein 33 isoform X2 [Colossoma macropomum]|uniref:RNA-binding protein 33 isoform X2 n=1 Tax=Colossoma macropomum TaxID=42526 RepID=UPI001864BB6E|nr:RNA-binding protein 33 isoform X2 [Colossoma macropomum]
MGGLQSAGVSPQKVPLTSAQSPANPAVDPSSLQDVADSSKLLHVQTNQTGILTGQHMFHQQHPTSELDSSPVLHGPVPMGAARRPKYSRDQGRPDCSPQRSLGLPSPTKTRPTSLFVPGGTSLLPASSSTTHSALQEKVPSVPRQSGNQRFPPNQNLLLSLPEPLPVLHPKPQNSQSCASSVQATPPACLHSLSSESQSSPHSRVAPLCCAVIRPRMVQISLNCSRALKNPPVLAHNSSFINAARPTPTPAAQVRPVARAVATGMPGAARQQASARAGACARTMPERVLAGKSRGQEVKEEPQSPLSLLSKKESERAEREERRADEDEKDSLRQSEAGEDDDGDGVSAWYRLQLEKQKQLREKLMSHKEKRRHLQAQYQRRQKQGKLHEVHLMGKILDGAPQRCPQPSQVSKRAQSTRKPTQKTRPSTSNLPQRDSESRPNLQLCQQQQHGSALLPPLKPPSKPAYPQTHLAQCSAAAAPVRRAVLWHRQSFHGQRFLGHDDASGGSSGELGEWHGRTRKMKRLAKELPSKLKVVKHVRMEEEEDGVSLRFPAQVSEGSRVVTFTRTTFCGPHALRQVCPNLWRGTASKKRHDKGLRFWSARRTCHWSDQHKLHRKV